VAAVDVDDVKARIGRDYHVWTSDQSEIGVMKHYDPVSGLMRVSRRPLPMRDLLIPVSLVEEVDDGAGDVTLVVSEADIRRMQHVEPVDVVSLEPGLQ
jgi:hypothetical protein